MASRYYFGVGNLNALIERTGLMKSDSTRWMRHSFLSTPQDTRHPNWRFASSAASAGLRDSLDLRWNHEPDKDFHVGRWFTPPLEAQSLSGCTVQLCLLTIARWITQFVNEAVSVRFGLHIYVSQGQTGIVRTVVLSNFLDSVDLPGPFSGTWRSLAAPQALTNTSIVAGDSIVVELFLRQLTDKSQILNYPPTDMTSVTYSYTGASGADPDAVAGTGFSNRNAWFEFSQTLLEQAAPPPPASGTTCATAIVIPTVLPFQSAGIDTSQAPGTDHELWFTWTSPAALPGEVDGSGFFLRPVIAHAFGTNYHCTIDIFRNSCAAPIGIGQLKSTSYGGGRSLSFTLGQVRPTTQYWIRIRAQDATTSAKIAAGILKFGLCWRESPAAGDLYVPCGALAVYREGQLVNARARASWTGIAFDYTHRPMDNLNGGTHSSDRVYVGLHDFNIIEIFDAATLNYFGGETEIDFVSDAFPGGLTPLWHPSQLALTSAGTLYTASFGNGYLYVAGEGTLPAIYNTTSSLAQYSDLKVLDATHADNQAGAPWPESTQITLPLEGGAAWAIAIDEAAGILYYTSGGLYVPFSARTIKRWSLTGGVPLSDLVTAVLLPGEDNGFDNDIKSIVVLPNGNVLACLGKVVKQYTAAGALVRTYTPDTTVNEGYYLTALALTPDALSFWVMDFDTTRIFKFNVATGAEELTFQPDLLSGTFTQLAVYTAGILPPEPPSPTPASCPVSLLPEAVVPPPACPVNLVP